MNLIINKGNLGQSARVRMIDGRDGVKTPVVNFSLAVKVGYGANERTEWRDCSWFGKSAEKCHAWLTKGREVVVSGEPSVRTYQKADGSTVAVMDVRVEKLDFCGTRGTSEEAPGASDELAGKVTTVMNAPAAQSAKASEEDVPF